MSKPVDISAVVTFHNEGAFCLPALRSLQDMADAAGSDGLNVEVLAVLDKPDPETRRLVRAAAAGSATVVEVSFGDLGKVRNHAAGLARGDYLTFLDGDDLWGAQWLRLAYGAATAGNAHPDTVWHPKAIYLFFESDFDRASFNAIPVPGSHSLYVMYHPSTAPDFDSRALLIENTWGAVAFARRDLHLRFPYKAVDRERGLGIEDWSWNIETLTAGIDHLVVENTVHLHRQKKAGSLGLQNIKDGLLPAIDRADFETLGMKRVPSRPRRQRSPLEPWNHVPGSDGDDVALRLQKLNGDRIFSRAE
jgi:glycosyltransferase involved in cell wall biosynthesis